MTFQDIPEIQQIDKICFNADAPRCVEGIKGYIEKSNNASIVYELDGKVVGYNFIHLWGNFAWFGSFGVNPEYQGRGIGKELIRHTIKFLKEDIRISNIGLQTMPESGYNVGMYMSMGFKPLKLSLSLIKQLEINNCSLYSSKYKVRIVDVSDESNYLMLKDKIMALSNKISHELDLSSQLYPIKYNDFGTVFVLEDNNEINGFALCHTKNIREFPSDCLEIKLLCINNTVDLTDALDSILNECVAYAKSIGYKNISVDCSTYNYDICMHLFSKHNFKIQKTQLIMIMDNENYINEYKGLVLCRWSG